MALPPYPKTPISDGAPELISKPLVDLDSTSFAMRSLLLRPTCHGVLGDGGGDVNGLFLQVALQHKARYQRLCGLILQGCIAGACDAC